MEQILTAIAPKFDSKCFLGLKSLLKNENKKDKKPIIEEPKDSKRHKDKRNKK